MGEITQIDLLVHPFFSYYCSNTKVSEEVSKEEAKDFLELWKGCIERVKGDKRGILIFVSNMLKDGRFTSIKEGAKASNYDYEALLAEYAYKNLGERLFFFYDTLDGNFLTQVERVVAGNPKVFVYGEWTSACCRREAKLLSDKLRIPRSNFSLLPKKSFDINTGYPSRKELHRILKLPKPERTAILRERMKLYTDMLRDFREGR